jgi:hypothetical protein
MNVYCFLAGVDILLPSKPLIFYQNPQTHAIATYVGYIVPEFS